MISYGHLSDFFKSDFLFHVHFSFVICDFLVESSQITIILMHVSFKIHYRNKTHSYWRMSYSQQQASIVWSGHWCTLLQCNFSDPIPSINLPQLNCYLNHDKLPQLCIQLSLVSNKWKTKLSGNPRHRPIQEKHTYHIQMT